MASSLRSIVTEGEGKNFNGDYLNREKITTLYNACSRFLHTPNPFDRRAIVRNKKTDSSQQLHLIE